MDYSRNFGSQFPNELIDYGTRKDIDNTVKNLIKQYYTYIDSGDILSAATLYNNNKSVMQPYIIDMSYINRIEEEIFNIGVDVLNQRSTTVSANEPPTQANDSFWLKEYS